MGKNRRAIALIPNKLLANMETSAAIIGGDKGFLLK
jgi:hypothetical protein